MKLIDLTGQTFGRLTVTERAIDDSPGTNWRCICECGSTTVVVSQSLREGRTRSCGCSRSELISRRKLQDLTGQVFGRLTAIKRTGTDRTGTPMWLCECECGTTTTTRSGALRRGDTKSCGCLNLERTAAMGRSRKTHGMLGHPLYATWTGVRYRCTNPHSPTYAYYGGRGIRMCDRWQGPEGFPNFVSDVGERPEGRTLDRIDVNGDYEPGNVRWATPSEQRTNQRVRIHLDDVTALIDSDSSFTPGQRAKLTALFDAAEAA